jgi:transcription initiation factor TFIID subunit 2
MPGIVDVEGAQAPQQESSEAHYAVTQQEVDLEVDFRSRTLKGRATIIIEPQSRDLKSVSLGCRQLNVTKITVDNYPVKIPKYRDPYAGLNVREGYGVHQHHQMRANVEDAVQEQPDPNLTIQFPKQVKIQELRTSDVTNAQGSLDGAVEAALANNLEDGEAMYVPIIIVVEYTVDKSRDSLLWVGLREGDSRYPHVYTCSSSLPGSLPCFVFPYLGSPSSKYSWRLSICCARTLGDLSRTSQIQENGHIKVDGANGHAVDSMDVDLQEDEFLQKLTSDERNRDIVVVGSGVVEDNDAPCRDNEHLRKWVFQCTVPVAPVHIGFTIGPFEEVDFSEFRETGKEDQLKDHAVGVRGYCLPGRAEELRNTCLPLQMAIDSFMQSYISYPFAPECQTYKMCFVDDIAQDIIDTATLSLCSSRLLFPETILDSVWENSRTLIRAAASQWLGVFITPKASSDYWIVVGASYFMAENFMAGLWGRNELRYRQKLAADAVKIRDRHMPSIHECGNAVSLDPAELEFLELKAPLILYLLHQRLVKQSSAVGVVRILTRMLSDARSGRLGANEIWTDRFIYTTEKVAHAKVQSFFDQWVYGSGVPSFLISQAFQKKKFSVAITIKQTQKLEVQSFQDQVLQAGNFFREVKELEHDIYAGHLQESFTGPMTIRVHEPSGLPYEQIVEIRDGETKVEFHYNSKNKNQLRKRRQRQKEAAAGGRAHVADDGDDFVPTYSLGDVLVSEAEAREWQLQNLTEDQEKLLENASYEWIRVDKDFEWIANTTFHPGGTPGELELMYIMQLQGDNDVVAHLEAIQRLSMQNPSRLLSSVFLRTLMDDRYFYGVRVKAAEALVNCAVKQLDNIGLFHLEKAFKTLFCYGGPAGMTKPNDFSDLRLYRIRCAIVQSMSIIRDEQGKAPKEVKQFFLDKLKFNDNSSNQVTTPLMTDTVRVSNKMHSTQTLIMSPSSSRA